MEISCFVPNCSQIVSFGCECRGTYTYFCTNHSSVHLSESQNLNHALISPLKSIPSDFKEIFIQKFQDIQLKLSSIKTSTLIYLSVITSEGNQILSKLAEVSSVIKKILSNIQLFNSIPMPIENFSYQPRSTFEESDFQYFQESFENSIKGDYDFFKIENFALELWGNLKNNESFIEEIESVRYQELNQVENFKYQDLPVEGFDYQQYTIKSFQTDAENFNNIKVLEKRIQNNEFSEPSGGFLHFFRDQSSNLITVDLADLKIKGYEINLKSGGCHFPCTTLINQENLFIHGGRIKNVYTGSTCILNLKTFSIQVFAEDSAVSSARPCLLDQQIFIFGGQFNWIPRKNSKSFNLISLTWKPIADLPVPMAQTVAIPLNDKLLVAGEIKKILLLYEYSNNRYERLNPGFEVSYKNVLARFGESVFLISDWIYECRVYDLYRWDMVNKVGLQDGSIITNAVTRDHLIFFADYSGNVHRFNCLERTVDIVLRIQ